MKRFELIANLGVGGIGAFGQGALLAHALHYYPFLILSSPPGSFYYSTGLALGFVAPPLSLCLLYIFRATPRPFVTAIPVVACPLIYWVLFRLVFALSGYHYAPPSTRSDLIATSAIENGFATEVVSLTLLGLITGISCGFFLWLVCKNRRVHKLA